MRIKPTTAISTPGDVIEPSVTNVSGLASTAPQFFSPRNARNMPMPAVTEYFRWLGIARTTACRAPMIARITKIAPEIATAPSAVCHGIFWPSTTVKAK